MVSASNSPPRIKPLSGESFIAQPLGIPSDSTTPGYALACPPPGGPALPCHGACYHPRMPQNPRLSAKQRQALEILSGAGARGVTEVTLFADETTPETLADL